MSERELRDPGVPVSSERASVRRTVLESLRNVNRTMRSLVATWHSGRQIYDGPAYRGPGEIGQATLQQWWRWRRWEEHPENDPELMRRHARMLEDLADQLTDAAAFLSAQAEQAKRAAAERKRQS